MDKRKSQELGNKRRLAEESEDDRERISGIERMGKRRNGLCVMEEARAGPFIRKHRENQIPRPTRR